MGGSRRWGLITAVLCFVYFSDCHIAAPEAAVHLQMVKYHLQEVQKLQYNVLLHVKCNTEMKVLKTQAKTKTL